jgi:hypothetical protein
MEEEVDGWTGEGRGSRVRVKGGGWKSSVEEERGERGEGEARGRVELQALFL